MYDVLKKDALETGKITLADLGVNAAPNQNAQYQAPSDPAPAPVDPASAPVDPAPAPVASEPVPAESVPQETPEPQSTPAEEQPQEPTE